MFKLFMKWYHRIRRKESDQVIEKNDWPFYGGQTGFVRRGLKEKGATIAAGDYYSPPVIDNGFSVESPLWQPISDIIFDSPSESSQ
ncbi:hypothetical protein SAMN05444266_102281 [Chitinophaga jiangningensis]|uniref:Uncharacterized protein n=1 Tax=Chitinophaga jiangningensis TaxID=1419482 RepID=A0A1M6YEV6_9BACT|nr:hypothetical protein SAMN05444266_102281 [Chitinophaga jiangningensis]